jgi:hypothetical protein
MTLPFLFPFCIRPMLSDRCNEILIICHSQKSKYLATVRTLRVEPFVGDMFFYPEVFGR